MDVVSSLVSLAARQGLTVWDMRELLRELVDDDESWEKMGVIYAKLDGIADDLRVELELHSERARSKVGQG
jgi:hypothetical protein